MNQTRWCGCPFWITAFVAMFSGLAFGADEASLPNIILCMGDDHGWGDVGYHGHPLVKTPNLDRMAAEGLRFDRWYAAAPVCSPTRGSCLTGRHPFRYGVYTANVGFLKDEEICLAEVLQQRGYATGHFGKWHLGTLTTTIEDANRGKAGSTSVFSPPWKNGFDVCFSTESKVPTFNPMKNPAAVSREARKGPEGIPYGTHYWIAAEKTVPDDELAGDDSKLIMDRALKFIGSAATAKKPFFAVIWFHAPHTPVVADEAHRSLYPEHPFGLYGQHYHGCITAMDEQIGRLRRELDQLGASKNTMLWYSADNGPESGVQDGAGTALPFRGRKRSLYEGGVRVPGILVWPSVVTRPRITETPCVSSDYFPTFLDVLGMKMPDRPYDGMSLLPLIKGESTSRNSPIGFQSGNQRSWVDDRYKLYTGDKGKTWELYDLQSDPSETTNLADVEPTRVQRMSNELKGWIASCEASDRGEDYARSRD